MEMKLFLCLTFLCSCFAASYATSKPVFVYSNETKQLFTSSILTWESYNPNDDLTFNNAIYGGHFNDANNSKAYICRGTINSIPVSGYVKKHANDKFVCIISQHQQFRTKQEFDLLINRGNGAKVEWAKWEKLSPYYMFNGLVSTGNGMSKTEIYYVARHPKNHSAEMEHHEIDHAIGFLEAQGLGKIYATVASSESSFEVGQLLRVIEPVRYEMSEIRFQSLQLRQKTEKILLGSTVLRNEGNDEVDVTATIGYIYGVIRNFGHHDGIARSVNTTAFMSGREKFEFFWGIQKEMTIQDSKSVSTRLLPGTAINVTLWGNYKISEGPYKAYIVTYYADGTKSKKRHDLFNAGYEKNLDEKLEIEYSPTYWLHNNTVMPTTTQRTTSTSTTTQNVQKSIFSTSKKNAGIERITTDRATQNEQHHHHDDDDDEDEENETSTASFISEFSFISLVIFSSLRVIF